MKVFAIMALLLVAAYSQSNEIDVVLKMLADLKNETTKQLQQLESDWTATKYVL
jgi:type II secretory pathway component PulF